MLFVFILLLITVVYSAAKKKRGLMMLSLSALLCFLAVGLAKVLRASGMIALLMSIPVCGLLMLGRLIGKYETTQTKLMEE